MSSETIHITRHNYEEYFLLYVDNELSAAERMAVENFASSHPDLREELDILLENTVLELPSASLEDKSFLMADSMKLNIMDDSLLLYIDNELGQQERSKVEKELRSNPEYQLQYNLLLSTKLQQEKILYPNKAELYRRTERAVGVYWLRVAAAVLVIAAITLVYFLNGDSASIQPAVAVADPKKENIVQPDKEQVAVVPVEQKIAPAEKRIQKSNKNVSVPVRQQIIPDDNKDNIAYAPVDKKTDPVPVVNTNQDVRTKAEVADTGNGTQQNINTTSVTDPPIIAYHIPEPGTTGPRDNDKSGSVKGLLRKATRFIEKRTGINPVNDNDELLIGMVSIKLK